MGMILRKKKKETRLLKVIERKNGIKELIIVLLEITCKKSSYLLLSIKLGK